MTRSRSLKCTKISAVSGLYRSNNKKKKTKKKTKTKQNKESNWSEFEVNFLALFLNLDYFYKNS